MTSPFSCLGVDVQRLAAGELHVFALREGCRAGVGHLGCGCRRLGCGRGRVVVVPARAEQQDGGHRASHGCESHRHVSSWGDRSRMCVSSHANGGAPMAPASDPTPAQRPGSRLFVALVLQIASPPEGHTARHDMTRQSDSDAFGSCGDFSRRAFVARRDDFGAVRSLEGCGSERDLARCGSRDAGAVCRLLSDSPVRCVRLPPPPVRR